MTEQEFNDQLKIIQEQNIQREYQFRLKEEKNKYKRNHKKPSTSKMLLWALIIICVEIVVFCEYAMLKLYDTSAMYALIGVPAALAPSLIGYFQKSMKENTVGGIVYDAALGEAELTKNEVEPEEDSVG